MSTQLPRATKSASIGELAKALCKVQGQLRPAKKSAENPFFKSHYADLNAIIEASRELLTANGLAITQTPATGANGELELVTTLMHTSGEWIEGSYPIKPIKPDPQSVGSAFTYARRYSYQGAIGLSAEDDDGNAASAKNGNGHHRDDLERGGVRPAVKDAREGVTYAEGSAGAHAALGADKAGPKAFKLPSEKQTGFLKTLMGNFSIPEEKAGEVVAILSGWPEFSSKNVSNSIEKLRDAGAECPKAVAHLVADGMNQDGPPDDPEWNYGS